jgi:sugar lactone lactonase YvrE
VTDEVELIVDAHAALAESPVWDDRIEKLYWIDLIGGVVHRTDTNSGADEVVPVGQSIGALALCEGDELLLAVEDGFGVLDPDTAEFELAVPIEADDHRMRMNDGKVDPSGRFWAGSMAYDERVGAGTLYRLDPEQTVTRMIEGVTMSNGLDWSDDRRTMYYIDTVTGRVDRFDYDDPSGTISARQPVVMIPRNEGYPDGMALDAEGYLWVALFDGWAVHRYAPDGRLDRRIELPAQQVTSVAFGGPDLEHLYITTGQEGFPAGGRPDQPHAGGVFRCRPGVRGRPTNRFRGRLGAPYA